MEVFLLVKLFNPEDLAHLRDRRQRLAALTPTLRGSALRRNLDALAAIDSALDCADFVGREVSSAICWAVGENAAMLYTQRVRNVVTCDTRVLSTDTDRQCACRGNGSGVRTC